MHNIKYKGRNILILINKNLEAFVKITKFTINYSKDKRFKVTFCDYDNGDVIYTSSILCDSAWSKCFIGDRNRVVVKVFDENLNVKVVEQVLDTRHCDFNTVDGINVNELLYPNINDVDTELCTLMREYGSDKSTYHNYTSVYVSLLEDKKHDNMNIFELGIGTTNKNIASNMGEYGAPGASLRAWSKYLPNSHIYSGDVDRDVLFSNDNISTYYCDSLSNESIFDMWKNIGDVDFDIIIDDGLHTFESNYNFLINSFPKLKDGGYYIIEDVIDVGNFNNIRKQLKNSLDIEYINIVELEYENNNIDNNLVIIRKKKKNNRCFVSFYCDYDKELSDVLKDSVDMYSDYELIRFTKSDFYYLDSENRYKFSPYIEKIFSCLSALRLGYDEVIWLDSDVVVTENIDHLWRKSDLILDYPLLFVHDHTTNINLELELEMEKDFFDFNLSRESNYLHACTMLFNSSCINFFESILKKYEFFKYGLFRWGDETIINCIILEKGYELNLGDNYFNLPIEDVHNIKEHIEKSKISLIHGSKDLEYSRFLLESIKTN